MKIDVALDAPLGRVAQQAQAYAAAGADGAFTLEANRDVFFPLVLAAHSGLELYPYVAIAFPRSPMHVAYQAWDLARLSGGRFALGLGTQIRPHVERRYGANWDRPVRQMRQYVEALRAVFATFQHGAPLDFRGDYHTLTLMTPTFLPGPLDCGPPPIWVGALGPRMTEMAAEVADGVLTHPFVTPQYLREHTLPAVTAGLARSGRSRQELTLGAGVITAVYRDEAERQAAERAARFTCAFYGSTPSYRPTLDTHGLGHLQPVLRDLSKQGRWDQMADTVPDELLDLVCVRGTPSRVAQLLRERYEGLVDRIALTVTHRDAEGLVEDTLAALATVVA